MKKHIIINYAKGLWTLSEVCKLLRDNNIEYKLINKSLSKCKTAVDYSACKKKGGEN